MIKPNFFIVGYPKTGTFPLTKNLEHHPRCFMARELQPCYFSKDLANNRKNYSWEEYIALYEGATKEHIAIGELSTQYIQSDVALNEIFQFNENARIIVIVRNPVDLVNSLHLYRINLGNETVKDFEKVWKLQETRKNGKNLPVKGWSPALWDYKKLLSVGDHMEKLMSIFPSDQFKCIVYDDLEKDMKKTYQEVLEFLGLPLDNKEDLHQLSEYKKIKAPKMIKRLRSLRRAIEPMVRQGKKILGVQRFGIMDSLVKRNTLSESEKPLSPKMRALLVEEFRDQVDKLSGIIGRDLSHWK